MEKREERALLSGITKNPDVSTGPLARLFVRSLTPLTHSLAPFCSLCSRAPLRSFVRSLTYSLTHSRARGKVDHLTSQIDLVLSHYGAFQTWQSLKIPAGSRNEKRQRCLSYESTRGGIIAVISVCLCGSREIVFMCVFVPVSVSVYTFVPVLVLVLVLVIMLVCIQAWSIFLYTERHTSSNSPTHYSNWQE